MAKGDDAVTKKRNKVRRKRLRNESSSVSARVASIIASKRRRKAGKRRMCEGMCFSLPTPEDPFNDRNDKKASSRKKPEKSARQEVDAISRFAKKGAAGSQKAFPRQTTEMVEQHDIRQGKVANQEQQKTLLTCLSDKYETMTKKLEKSKTKQLKKCELAHARQELHRSTDYLSKYLIMCLNAIQKAWMHDDTFGGDVERPLLANSWGIEFWKYCSVGSDILVTSGACSSREQIAWLVSTAADVISRKEKEGLIVGSPFLLFIVPSQEKTIKVRSVCKPLKAVGIHTVSLHAGASVDHQIQGLKSCEPEFLVSTPERLCELISLRAVDISNVSLLVFDGLESFVDDGLSETITSIRECVLGDSQVVIFSDCSGDSSTSVGKNLLRGPVSRLSLEFYK